jgi:rubrerythrin
MEQVDTQCPNCGKLVPQSNLVLHQILCNGSGRRRGQDSYPSADPQHAREVVRETPIAYPRVQQQFVIESSRRGERTRSPEQDNSRSTQRTMRPVSPSPADAEMDADLARAIELSLREQQQQHQSSQDQNRQRHGQDNESGSDDFAREPWRCQACGARNVDPYELTCEMCNSRRPSSLGVNADAQSGNEPTIC